MSVSLAVADGDLVLRGNNLAIVWGIEKLKQDIDLWLRERFGIDRFHPSMGSTLEEYIGSPIDQNTRSEIHSEVFRVLENYQRLQERVIRQTPQKLSATELLININSINVKIEYDTVWVSVNVSNAAGQSAVVTANSSV